MLENFTRRDFLNLSYTLGFALLPGYRPGPEQNSDSLFDQLEKARQNCLAFIQSFPDLSSVGTLIPNPVASESKVLQNILFPPLLDFRIMHSMQRRLMADNMNPQVKDEADQLLGIKHAFEDIVRYNLTSLWFTKSPF